MNNSQNNFARRRLGVLAAIIGLAGVLLGAFGAHALKARLEASHSVDIWRTAVDYHLLHAAGLLVLAVWLEVRSVRAAGGAVAGGGFLVWAGRCWVAGVVCFSGSLYVLALGGPSWLGPVTPLGGLAFLAGWVLVGLAARRF